jgi:hypothetical protein
MVRIAIATAVAGLLGLSCDRVMGELVFDYRLAPAPVMGTATTKETHDLGTFDDIFSKEGMDDVIVRRGNDFFAVTSGALKKVATVADGDGVKIIDGTQGDGHTWLFLEPKQGPSFALDLVTQKRVDLGMGESPKDKPGGHLQSRVFTPGAAMLMLDGGGAATWPRPGNRPVYFWMNLASGKAMPMPVGWDLDYFSDDQSVAVFEKPKEREGYGRKLQAVDMKTGEAVSATPDRQLVSWVDFDWSYRSAVRPIYGTEQRILVGFNVLGSVYPLELGGGPDHYVSDAKSDGSVVVWLGQEGTASQTNPTALWRASIKKRERPLRVGTGITDLAISGKGFAVLSAIDVAKRGGEEELTAGRPSRALLYSMDDGKAWDVLDKVERLPPLAAEFINKPYIIDDTRLELIQSSSGLGPVLCIFDQDRRDARATDQAIPPESWRRAVLISNGGRYMTDLFRDESPQKIFLDKSGTTIVVKAVNGVEHVETVTLTLTGK